MAKLVLAIILLALCGCDSMKGWLWIFKEAEYRERHTKKTIEMIKNCSCDVPCIFREDDIQIARYPSENDCAEIKGDDRLLLPIKLYRKGEIIGAFKNMNYVIGVHGGQEGLALPDDTIVLPPGWHERIPLKQEDVR